MGAEPNFDVYKGISRWIDTAPTVEAMRMCIIGLFAIGLGSTVAELYRPHNLDVHWNPAAETTLGQAGSAMLTAGILAWLYFLVSNAGWGVFVGSYPAMLAATEDAPMAIVYLVINLSIPLLAGTTYRTSHLPGYVAGMIFVVLGFPLGLRGEILFPAATVVVILTCRRKLRVRPQVFLLGILLVLSAAAIVRQIRSIGVSDAPLAEVSISPLHGLMELGGTLYPVTAVVHWAEAGEDYIYGASYWAPFERTITRFVPYTERLPSLEDDRLMNVLVIQRNLGPVGFSPVAEGYRNFGPWGVVMAMALIGLIVGRIGHWPRHGAWPTLIGMVLLPLMNHVRNSFAPVPATIGVGVLLVGAIVSYRRVPPASVSSQNRLTFQVRSLQASVPRPQDEDSSPTPTSR